MMDNLEKEQVSKTAKAHIDVLYGEYKHYFSKYVEANPEEFGESGVEISERHMSDLKDGLKIIIDDLVCSIIER